MEEGIREHWSWGGPWGTPPTLGAGWGALSAPHLLCLPHCASDVGRAKCQVAHGKMGFAVKWVWLVLGFAQTAWKEKMEKLGFRHAPGTCCLKDRRDVVRAELPPKDP